MQDTDFRLNLWISVLYRFRRCHMNRRLARYGSAGAFSILLALVEKKDGINQEQIAALLKIDKATVARSVKKLEQDGYLRRRASPEDKRAYQIFLEPKTAELLPELHRSMAEWDERVLRGIPGEKREILSDCLRQMAQNACAFADEDSQA